MPVNRRARAALRLRPANCGHAVVLAGFVLLQAAVADALLGDRQTSWIGDASFVVGRS